jgi:putative addiction module component (TIGR02574 family)
MLLSRRNPMAVRSVKTFKDLDREVQRLSADERIELADSLLQSVDDEEDPEYERLVMEEIERRCREIDEGRAKLIPGEQVLAQLRAELASMKRTPEIREDIKIVRPFEEIKHDALQLSADDRLELAYAILRDLKDEGFEVDWETLEVVGRR